MLVVADPGFPMGAPSSYILKIVYIKTKESGPLAGTLARWCPLTSANVRDVIMTSNAT